MRPAAEGKFTFKWTAASIRKPPRRSCEAGADVLVAGSAVFGAAILGAVLRALRER